MADNTEGEEVPEKAGVINAGAVVDLDLTSEGISLLGYSPATTPYDPRRDREKARRWIALLLLALLVGGVVVIRRLLPADFGERLSGLHERMMEHMP